jgi:hypothetical protein
MECRKNNKRKICCQIFIKVLEEKRRPRTLLQAVARLKWHQRTIWEMAEFCSSATFLSLASHQSFPSVSFSGSQLKIKNIFKIQMPKMIVNVHCTIQNNAFI